VRFHPLSIDSVFVWADIVRNPTTASSKGNDDDNSGKALSDGGQHISASTILSNSGFVREIKSIQIDEYGVSQDLAG
jgi:hypothetical protein